MSLLLAEGGSDLDLTPKLADLLSGALNQLGARHRVLVVPPDHSRIHSRAGDLTRFACEYYGADLKCILPALGTHRPMSSALLERMFGKIPQALFATHRWQTDIVTVGEVPSEFIHQQSQGKLNYPWPVQVNHRIVSSDYDLILSIGQVVPHEVVGMANYNKNILVGTGGPESIHRSHYLGAICGMEQIMGRADTPVRAVLNYASDHFLGHLPILYVLTVIGRDSEGRLPVRGIFVGDDIECFHQAAQLSQQVNTEILDNPLRKAVVFLDPREFHSTWIGNKSIYRTRMAMADDGELIILAPGVDKFGEDAAIDRLVRKHGYRGTAATQAAVDSDPELAASLASAAHLIHGSSEGRFRIRWAPGRLSREEVESVGYEFGECHELLNHYDPESLRYGYNTVGSEEIYFVPNPGLGLWSTRERFNFPTQ